MNSETLVINQVHKPSVEGKMNSETLVIITKTDLSFNY